MHIPLLTKRVTPKKKEPPRPLLIEALYDLLKTHKNRGI
jgi:hypothetical protein